MLGVRKRATHGAYAGAVAHVGDTQGVSSSGCMDCKHQRGQQSSLCLPALGWGIGYACGLLLDQALVAVLLAFFNQHNRDAIFHRIAEAIARVQ